jgi:ribosomal protein L40E
MSFATSTEAPRRRARQNEAAAAGAVVREPFRPWHFFFLCAMLAATAAVIVAPDNRPGNLLLVSAAVTAAGLVALAFHRMLSPLLAPEASQVATTRGRRARESLEREKALVLRSIKELEFDRAMGKVAESDFQEMRGRLRGRAIGLMKQLEDDQPAYRDLIEREVQRRLTARERTGPDRDAAPPLEVSVQVCARCETRNDADARFCKQCGEKIGRAGSDTSHDKSH